MAVDLNAWAVRHVMPNFLVVGAQKAGTTSLHSYLHRHPEIFMSQEKENNFFLDDSRQLNTLFDYHRKEPETYGASSRSRRRGLSDESILRRWMTGYKGERVFGDTSPYYTCAGILPDNVPGNIARVNPDTRFVYMVRDPIQRIISSYRHDVKQARRFGRELETLEHKLTTCPHLVELSCYYTQMLEYLKLFDREQIQIVVFERFIDDPRTHLNAICEFLGLAEYPDNVSFTVANRTSNEHEVDDVTACYDTRVIDRLRTEARRLSDCFNVDLSHWNLLFG